MQLYEFMEAKLDLFQLYYKKGQALLGILEEIRWAMSMERWQ